MLLGLKNFKICCWMSQFPDFSSPVIISFQKLCLILWTCPFLSKNICPILYTRAWNSTTDIVCYVDFLLKFFDKMANKRDFLKIINLYLLPSHPWKNPLPNPPRLENLVPNPRKLKNEVPTFLQMTKWTRVLYRVQIQTQMMKVMLWTLVIFRLFSKTFFSKVNISEKWYFVSKIVLTYYEKKMF